MTRKLVELLSEQPVYNLLSIRHLEPEEVLFIGTREHHVSNQHLHSLVSGECPVHLTEVFDPYDPPSIRKTVAKKIRKLGWKPEQLIFDLSGGTKMMAFALHKLALDNNSLLADLEYIRGRYYFRLYKFTDGLASLKENAALPGIISISDYLNAHLPGFKSDGFHQDKKGHVDAGGHFEASIYHALKKQLDEIISSVRPAGVKQQIEIDMVIRSGNNVGIIEAKTGANKAGIDQLDTAGNPIYLGEHTIKFLVTGRYLSPAHKALALAQKIHVVELPGYSQGRGLGDKDKRHLVQIVGTTLTSQRQW